MFVFDAGLCCRESELRSSGLKIHYHKILYLNSKQMTPSTYWLRNCICFIEYLGKRYSSVLGKSTSIMNLGLYESCVSIN